MIALAALLLAGERTVAGVFDRWAAFRDTQPLRCYAIAQPVSAIGGAFAAVSVRVGAERRSVLFVRLSSPPAPGAAITLAIGERRFSLTGSGATDARAPDAAADRAIVGAMRGGRSMSVTAVSARGAPIADTYALAGAATAIDAAALGCSAGARP